MTPDDLGMDLNLSSWAGSAPWTLCSTTPPSLISTGPCCSTSSYCQSEEGGDYYLVMYKESTHHGMMDAWIW